uniref:Uncharacterized protein n=1 Tax=Anguilla anguilla TaxID=7936 RepID=A0A0E9R7B0_ANGAN
MPARWSEKIVRSTDAPAWAKFQPGVDIQFSLYQLRPLLQRRLVVEEMMGVKVRSLYYLFGEMLCLGRRLLMAQVSCQILQLLLALL